MDIVSYLMGKKSGGGGSVPEYSGSYSVTPSEQTQTLATKDKKLTDDVTVAAMPTGSATTPRTAVQVTPSIHVDSNERTGVASVTAEVNIRTNPAIQVTPIVEPGYVESGTAGEVYAIGSNYLYLDTIATHTYTPTAADQTIAKNHWLTGVQTIKGDQNLVPGNIKNGVTIFNVTGTYEGSGGGLTQKNDVIQGTGPLVNPQISFSECYNVMDGSIDGTHICYGLLTYSGTTSALLCEMVYDDGQGMGMLQFDNLAYKVFVMKNSNELTISNAVDKNDDYSDITQSVTSFTIISIS